MAVNPKPESTHHRMKTASHDDRKPLDHFLVSVGQLKSAPNKPQQPAAHSPLPWRVTPPKGTLASWTITSDCDVAQVLWTGSNERAYDNAKLIIRAVNHADKLAEALREAYDFIDILLANTPSEATDLLTNHGEDVNARLETALKAYEADRA